MTLSIETRNNYVHVTVMNGGKPVKGYISSNPERIAHFISKATKLVNNSLK